MICATCNKPIHPSAKRHYHPTKKENTTMATKTPTTDPLAGLPIGTTRPPRKPAAPAAAPGNVTTIAQGRAALKRRRLTGEEFRNAVKFARDMTGYGDTSPIWGKRLVVVLNEIVEAIDNGDTTKAKTYATELQKRIATGQVIKAQS